MRSIGTVPDEAQARQLGDYLLTLGITTRIDRAGEGWAVWVHREEQVERARGELEAFRQHPDDPKYRAAAPAAKSLRKQAKRVEREHLRNTLDVRYFWGSRDIRRCPLTWVLIGLSVGVTLLSNFGGNPRMRDSLIFASYRVRSAAEVPPDGPPDGAVVGDFWYRSDVRGDLRRGEVWRLVTPIFLHFSVIHLLLDMGALYQLGCLIEIRRGTRTLAVLVLLSAVLSNLGQYLYTGLPMFGGMSGVDLALFGYAWMKGMYEPDSGLAMHRNTVLYMILFLMVTTLQTIPGLPSIAHAAHLVGLTVGLLMGLGPHLLGSLRPGRD